jgi:hypothetical protein
MAKDQAELKRSIDLAKDHLKRVQDAKDGPDWTDLGTYGLYCLEALVRAAALKIGEGLVKTHWQKVQHAKALTKQHGLPAIDDLLEDLNTLRKEKAYGDEDFDESAYDPDDIVTQIEKYFEAVSDFCK